ncbi:uncharacterized protein LOC112055106 [Bicyclus anynana]|uniref:MOG interacting and ectopic P-granules protein 1 n=1 Tax=Bicyclus anynana TaxID=110368 RepID=A0A6J1NW07_BICAN|nr:uncharacterized protein LOC112055106 [Bicyclus anynana]XP_023950874.1 uncharacterized protein LOC112055106 [Bicyclus anynana]
MNGRECGTMETSVGLSNTGLLEESHTGPLKASIELSYTDSKKELIDSSAIYPIQEPLEASPSDSTESSSSPNDSKKELIESSAKNSIEEPLEVSPNDTTESSSPPTDSKKELIESSARDLKEGPLEVSPIVSTESSLSPADAKKELIESSASDSLEKPLKESPSDSIESIESSSSPTDSKKELIESSARDSTEEPLDVSPSGSKETSLDDTNPTSQPENITNGTENHCSGVNNQLSSKSTDLLDSKENTVITDILDKEDNNCNDDTSIMTVDDDSTNQIFNEEYSEKGLNKTDNEKNNQEKNKDTKQGDIDANVSKKIQNSDNKLKRKRLSSSDVLVLSDNDDSVIELKDDPQAKEEDKPPLRRSSRVIKRKRYDNMENKDYESDVDDVPMNDVKSKHKPIMTNSTKPLIEIATKQIRSATHKKENTVINLDINRKHCNRPQLMHKNPMPINKVTAQNLCQSILARGTTVTPVSTKPAYTQASKLPAQPVLPSLTDDMFVVEAPSFIVPYVYEKPSNIPFRKFVDELGKEIEQLNVDDPKKNEEKADDTLDTEVKEIDKKIEQDENENAEEKTEDNAEDDIKTKKSVKGRGRRKVEDDDLSWDGSSSDSDEDIDGHEKSNIVIIKSEASNEINDVPGITVEPKTEGKSNIHADMPLGKFFTEIGLHLVQEYVQNDLLKQQVRKLNVQEKKGQNTKSIQTCIASLTKNIEISKTNNAPYRFKLRKCEFCTFKTESLLAMKHHLETPHMKNSVYKCNFCEFDSKSPHDILHHMEAQHNIRGRLERAPAYHQCANCPFEDNGKGKLARHLIACAKKFKPEFNLTPPVDWEPPAKIPKMARANNQFLGAYHNMLNKGQSINNNFGRPVVNSLGASSMCKPRGRSPMNVPSRFTPVQGIPIVRGATGMYGRNNSTQVQMSSNFSGNHEKNMSVQSKTSYQPSISITPLMRQPNPLQQSLAPPPGQQNKSSCVICEICDGYIKDLEQLRSHMQWIHKVKIHPKMIHNRPPLNCQKCEFRFFTDQGLERHLLGSHGLVTSSMQEAANKGKDGGRCPVCGRVYQCKLLNHVTREHKLMLKPAHLSYKCTVCTATFGMYKQFESHVYSKHSVLSKHGTSDKDKTPAPVKAGQSLRKQFKINNDVTITPKSVPSAEKSGEKSIEKVK